MSSITGSELKQKIMDFNRAAVTGDEVVRSLISYQGWLVPVMTITKNLNPSETGESHVSIDKPVVIFSTEFRLPVNELWVFTDQAAAELAQVAGAKLGIYANEVAGTEVFGNVDPQLELIRINPFSPPEQDWQFLQKNFDYLRYWSRTIAIESAFNRPDGADLEAIIQFEEFSIYNHVTAGYTITLPNQGGLTNPAVAFTTPDCYAAFESKLTAEQLSTMKRYLVDGLTLCEQLPLQKIDGIFFNPFGPGTPYVLSLPEAEA